MDQFVSTTIAQSFLDGIRAPSCDGPSLIRRVRDEPSPQFDPSTVSNSDRLSTLEFSGHIGNTGG
jgi:hypothetical protein